MLTEVPRGIEYSRKVRTEMNTEEDYVLTVTFVVSTSSRYDVHSIQASVINIVCHLRTFCTFLRVLYLPSSINLTTGYN